MIIIQLIRVEFYGNDSFGIGGALNALCPQDTGTDIISNYPAES